MNARMFILALLAAVAGYFLGTQRHAVAAVDAYGFAVPPPGHGFAYPDRYDCEAWAGLIGHGAPCEPLTFDQVRARRFMLVLRGTAERGLGNNDKD
jgi:hypothetical protein